MAETSFRFPPPDRPTVSGATHTPPQAHMSVKSPPPYTPKISSGTHTPPDARSPPPRVSGGTHTPPKAYTSVRVPPPPYTPRVSGGTHAPPETSVRDAPPETSAQEPAGGALECTVAATDVTESFRLHDSSSPSTVFSNDGCVQWRAWLPCGACVRRCGRCRWFDGAQTEGYSRRRCNASGSCGGATEQSADGEPEPEPEFAVWRRF
ncbi:hypothetical protein E2562_014787 [Oryza meyeriana var. granulata]|uniref:Uncharacterized protein n=1 Tax=Oryza meyeriana var. granulata TaxID=110450 RepID=A0A6G1BX29_9ORYZ|nr:hypothetical protein E2562_014787 [Oryza meyeriana var. granulata]